MEKDINELQRQQFEYLERQADAELGPVDAISEETAAFYAAKVIDNILPEIHVAQLARSAEHVYLSSGRTVPEHVLAATRPLKPQNQGAVSHTSVAAAADQPPGFSRVTARILIYTDKPFLVKGLESALREVGGFEFLPTCSSVSKVKKQVAIGAVDLVLLDVTNKINLAALNDIKQAMMSCKIVLWADREVMFTGLASEAMCLGVPILFKNRPTCTQVEYLQRVLARDLRREDAVTRRLALAQRNKQIDIDTRRRTSKGMVKVYFSRLFQKIGSLFS
jgi:hypothetical protein